MADSPPVAPTGRRRFLQAVNYVVGGAIAAAAAVPFLRYLFFPVRPARPIVDSADRPVPVLNADLLPKDGKPVRVEIVVAEQRDAWARARNVRLGAAWISRTADGGVRAFSATCPHLGCAVQLDEASQPPVYRCPCHKSRFSLDGERGEGSPAKRGLDPLEAKIEDGRVVVRFARFKLDTSAREKG